MTDVLDIREVDGPTVLRIHRRGSRGATVSVGIVRDGGRIDGESVPLTPVQLAQAAMWLADDTDERDQAMIEQIEDDRAMFQALCTERDRIAASTRVQAAALNRIARLIRIQADKLNEYPGTEAGCPCIVLPSGKLHRCPGHKLSRWADAHDAKTLGGAA